MLKELEGREEQLARGTTRRELDSSWRRRILAGDPDEAKSEIGDENGGEGGDGA